MRVILLQHLDALVNSDNGVSIWWYVNMFGGVKALEGLKEPFVEKLKESLQIYQRVRLLIKIFKNISQIRLSSEDCYKLSRV